MQPMHLSLARPFVHYKGRHENWKNLQQEKIERQANVRDPADDDKNRRH